jgi:predicted phosphodiesterase
MADPRIAIVSDVHGNLVALEAVIADLERAAPDLVVQGGDLVIGGPRPAECVDRIRELGWPGVIGNIDTVVRGGLPSGIPPALAERLDRQVSWTAERLGEDRVAWLQTLPMEWRDGDRVALVHAVPGNLWQVVLPTAEDSELRTTFGPLGVRLAVFCHIHVPFVRQVGDLTVANAGSVGSPYDGDPRASYLLVEDGQAAVRRVAYDVERVIADLEASGAPDLDVLAAAVRTGSPPAWA